MALTMMSSKVLSDFKCSTETRSGQVLISTPTSNGSSSILGYPGLICDQLFPDSAIVTPDSTTLVSERREKSDGSLK